MLKNKVLILDFGSQLTQLIARKVRSLNIYCEIIPYKQLKINSSSNCPILSNETWKKTALL